MSIPLRLARVDDDMPFSEPNFLKAFILVEEIVFMHKNSSSTFYQLHENIWFHFLIEIKCNCFIIVIISLRTLLLNILRRAILTFSM